MEKIIEERKQAGDSGEHSPYRVKLTAMDNSWVMFTIGSSGTPQKMIKSKPVLCFFFSYFYIEERWNYSLEQSPLRNKELSGNKKEERKSSIAFTSMNSFKTNLDMLIEEGINISSFYIYNNLEKVTEETK